ncbi:MAG TPA: GAF domain-containing SpoIIE family protein phosphatase, partial [Coriobacteriia bacterium]|nr:GAF domain-containing SpoIIE family protein phosphatase [Coriobacteriia bacterium]
AENVANHIRRSPDGPLEEVFGTFDITLAQLHGSPHLVVTAVETTESALLAQDYKRLHEDETRRLTFAETMDRVNTVIHSSLDYDEVMQRSLEEATKALGARAGSVILGSECESEARYIFGIPHALLGRRFSADVFPFSTLMEEKKVPIPVGAEDMGHLMNPLLARAFRVRSLLAIPLVLRGRLVGGIGLIYGRPHEFTTAELNFAKTFGASVSLALENAQLYRRQEHVADTLQAALLVLPERIPGVLFATAYNSASTASKVGGDFFDLFELEHNRVAFTVGDISGKGLDAAVLTSLVKHAVRTRAMEARTSPAAVMKVVNKVLLEGSGPEAFATVFFGILDCDNGVLVYCNAGHTTAALARSGGAVEKLGSNSQLVGALEQASFANDETTLERDDTLLLYTDGLTEARAGKEFFGEERLMRLVHLVGAEEPEVLVGAVLDAVLEFSGGELTDDVAILALQLE